MAPLKELYFKNLYKLKDDLFLTKIKVKIHNHIPVIFPMFCHHDHRVPWLLYTKRVYQHRNNPSKILTSYHLKKKYTGVNHNVYNFIL